MKVEHITMGGNSVIRDTSVILLETVNLLQDFKIKEGSALLPFPQTDFQVKITATAEGSIFDMMKDANIATSNVCSFNKSQASGLLNYVKQLSKGSLFKSDIIREPELSEYIYTIPVNPLILSINEMRIAGEIELYIYYMLYLAQT